MGAAEFRARGERHTFTQCVLAAFVGASAALTIAGALLPLERSLFLLLAAACALGGAFLGLVLWPQALARSAHAPQRGPSA